MDGKVTLVTGGNSGIGRAAALTFSREGAKVVVASRSAQAGEETIRAIDEAGGEAIFVRTDVSEASQVEALVAEAIRAYGRLDCAFNNAAARGGAFRDLADFEEDEFDRVVDTNLKGVWLCMKHEIRQMLDQEPPGGAIVNTSSTSGLGGVQQAALYSATKAGVLALTKSAAQEYAQRGIRANALVPGPLPDTDAGVRVGEDVGGDTGRQPERRGGELRSGDSRGQNRQARRGCGRRGVAVLGGSLLRHRALNDRRWWIDGLGTLGASHADCPPSTPLCTQFRGQRTSVQPLDQP